MFSSSSGWYFFGLQYFMLKRHCQATAPYHHINLTIHYPYPSIPCKHWLVLSPVTCWRGNCRVHFFVTFCHFFADIFASDSLSVWEWFFLPSDGAADFVLKSLDSRAQTVSQLFDFAVAFCQEQMSTTFIGHFNPQLWCPAVAAMGAKSPLICPWLSSLLHLPRHIPLPSFPVTPRAVRNRETDAAGSGHAFLFVAYALKTSGETVYKYNNLQRGQ